MCGVHIVPVRDSRRTSSTSQTYQKPHTHTYAIYAPRQDAKASEKRTPSAKLQSAVVQWTWPTTLLHQPKQTASNASHSTTHFLWMNPLCQIKQQQHTLKIYTIYDPNRSGLCNFFGRSILQAACLYISAFMVLQRISQASPCIFRFILNWEVTLDGSFHEPKDSHTLICTLLLGYNSKLVHHTFNIQIGVHSLQQPCWPHSGRMEGGRHQWGFVPTRHSKQLTSITQTCKANVIVELGSNPGHICHQQHERRTSEGKTKVLMKNDYWGV